MVVYTLFLGEAGPGAKYGSEMFSKAYANCHLLFVQRWNFFIYVQVGRVCRNRLTKQLLVAV